MPCAKPSCQQYFSKRSYCPQYVTPGPQKLGAQSLPPLRKAGMADIVVSSENQQSILFSWECGGNLKSTSPLMEGTQITPKATFPVLSTE